MWGALGGRAPPPPGAPGAVTLADRAAAFRCGVLAAKCAGDADGADRLGVRLSLVGLQERAVRALEALAAAEEGAGAPPRAARPAGVPPPAVTAAALAAAPRSLAELYNDVAAPYGLWGLALEAVALARYGDAPFVRSLWDVFLRSAWDEGLAGGGGLGGGPGADVDAAGAGRAAMGAAAADAAGRLPPGDPAVPLPHLALRLAQAAAGTWPAPAPGCPDFEAGAPSCPAAAATLVACARGGPAAAADAAAALLDARPADPGGDEAADPATRAALLGLLADVLAARAERLGAGGGGDDAAAATAAPPAVSAACAGGPPRRAARRAARGRRGRGRGRARRGGGPAPAGRRDPGGRAGGPVRGAAGPLGRGGRPRARVGAVR